MATEHFPDHELNCRHCGKQGMDPGFLVLLEGVRIEYGKLMVPSSAYRCPEYTALRKFSKRHMVGKSIDILVCNANALRLIEIALRHGFLGIGVSQRGPHAERFIHLDTIGDWKGNFEMWSYP